MNSNSGFMTLKPGEEILPVSHDATIKLLKELVEIYVSACKACMPPECTRQIEQQFSQALSSLSMFAIVHGDNG